MVFFTVVFSTTVPKFSLLAETFTNEAPVPDRVTSCGLEESESLMISDPARVPAWVGLNTTLMVQLALDFKVVVQVWVEIAKSPVMVGVPMDSVAVP